MNTAHPAFNQARQALSDEWPNAAAYIGGGGSIPIAGHFKEILGHGRDADRFWQRR